MTKEQFQTIFATKLVVAFPAVEINKFTTKLYWDHFKETPVDKFIMAVDTAVAEEEYFPTVSALRKYLKQNIKGLISFEETYCIIKEIMEKAYKSSWSSKDYPISVVRIIEKCGHISGLAQLSSEELLRTLKKQHRDIEKEMIKEETIKKLSGGNNGN